MPRGCEGGPDRWDPLGAGLEMMGGLQRGTCVRSWLETSGRLEPWRATLGGPDSCLATSGEAGQEDRACVVVAGREGRGRSAGGGA